MVSSVIIYQSVSIETSTIDSPSPENEVKILSSYFLDELCGRLDQVEGRVTLGVPVLAQGLQVGADAGEGGVLVAV